MSTTLADDCSVAKQTRKQIKWLAVETQTQRLLCVDTGCCVESVYTGCCVESKHSNTQKTQRADSLFNVYLPSYLN